jgi:hypothetical protein
MTSINRSCVLPHHQLSLPNYQPSCSARRSSAYCFEPVTSLRCRQAKQVPWPHTAQRKAAVYFMFFTGFLSF